MKYISVIITITLLSLFSATILFIMQNTKDNVNSIRYAPREKCSKGNHFSISENGKNDAVTKSPNGFNFFGNGWIEFMPCKNTIIKFLAKADIFDSVAANLTVISGNSIKHFPIKERRGLYFYVKRQDRIMIGFTNDHYEANSRYVTISFAKFQGEACSSIKFIASDDNEVSWMPETQKMGISGKSIARIKPCSSGTLNFNIRGSSFDGNFPIVQLVSKGEIFGIINTARINKYFSYKVGGEEIYVKIVNPANQNIKDRNVFIEDIALISR